MKASGSISFKISEDIVKEVESEVEPLSTQNTEYEDMTEALIMAISRKQILFDFRIPLKNRSKHITDNLWNEVHNEINCAIPLKDLPILPSKFKSYRSLRKPASGSSVVYKNQNESTMIC